MIVIYRRAARRMRRVVDEATQAMRKLRRLRCWAWKSKIRWSALREIETQTHEHIKVTDVARLPQELEPKLAAFIAGR